MTYGLGLNPYEEREPPEKEPKVPPTVAERPTKPTLPPIHPALRPQEKMDIPDIPYTVKDPYTGKDIDLVLKQGMFLWREDKLEGFFTKRGDFITTRPEETSLWEKTEAFFSNMWRGLPINPYYWKSPQAKWEADRKDALIAWAKEANIENPEEYATDLMSKESKELAWEAYEPEEGRLRVPEYPLPPIGERVTVGERFVGEWVIPMLILSGVGASAIKGRAALAAKPGIVPKIARAALAPVEVYEKAVATGLKYGVGVPLKGISTVSRKAFEKALDLGLDKWLVRQGIRGDQANKVVQYFLKVNNRWLYQQAETSVKKSLAKKIAATQAGRVAANDVVKAAEPMLRDAIKSVTGRELVPITPAAVKPLVVPPVKPPTVPTPVTPEVIDVSGLNKAIEMHRDWLEIPKKEIPGYPLLAREDFAGLIGEKNLILKAIEENKNLDKALDLVNEYLDEHKFLLSRGVEEQGGWSQERWVDYYSNLKEQLERRLAIPKAKVEVAKPPVEVTPEVTKPPTGIKYVFNLKKFRFEPQAVELALGISPEADKLTNLVKAAKPVRELTEALKHEELSKRVGAAAATAKATGAQKAAFAAMAKLKGELPTATFTPPEAGLTEGEIAALYNQVKSKLLVGDQKFFKWLNTDAALRKLLAGNIPTRGEIELLEGMFGSELAGAILAKRPLNEKIWEATVDILNIPRAILASFDFSAWLRQGAFIVTGYPPIGAKALAIDLRTFFSGKYTAEIDTAIHAGKFAQLREDSGLYLAPVEEGVAVKLAAREETFMSRLVKKIPIVGIGVRLSERAYLSTLNYMRASTFDYYAAKWEKMDYPMKTYNQLATLINWATGRGPIGKLGNMVPVINSVFFAARLQTSRIGMLFAGPAKFTSPPVRRAYIRMMLAFFGSMSAIVALLELTGVATTNTDPRSTDFGKIRIGNTRLDPWAGFRPIITVLAQTITGQRKTATERIQDVSRQETLLRFLRSKYAPAMGLITDILKGETYLGEEMTLETESLREQFYQRLTPLFIQDMIDSINEDGWMGGAVASPGVLGVGVVTYPGSIDAYERHVVDIPEDMLQDWQRGIVLSGEPLTYQNLNVVQKSWLIRHCEEIGDIPERKEPGQFNFYEAERETREELETKLNEEIEPVITGLLQGEITIADYITQSDHLRNKYFGTAAYMWRDSMREKLDPLLHKNLEKWHEEEIKPSDKAYEEYMDIRANPPTKAGVPDWDAWADKLKGFLSQQTPEIRDYIEARQQSWIDALPPDRQKIERLIVICEKVLDDYYAQPEKAPKGKPNPRLVYRERNPDVDIKLNLLGRVTMVRSDSARTGLIQWADAWGIPYSSIPALVKEAPTPPREEGLGPNPFE